MSQIDGDERMTTIDLPKSLVYCAVLLGFVLMSLRSLQVAIGNWRRGYSMLERPERLRRRRKAEAHAAACWALSSS